ncbi:MAG: hypothetical protein IJH07_10020 [Ruminococcus sp.]|nr:hypothetical protein [Ruminococcus sp.]
MKLNEEFILHSLDEETLLVPTGNAVFHGLIQGNKTVDVILHCLLKDATEDDILAVLKEKFVGNEDDMRADIREVITKLRAIGAIDD